ncbi:ABC transporter ATP-binding protein [Marinospirillum alkaliphilum]|uniref:ABC transporter n=1 Tax=Marinospirillum alkaliphilum DSM 21637 TaxID=1122209 RepID=A0A1K1ZK25_9GAMM|nr:ABC transporter ATP-binding protein [Marinospirillum alkaliphilum]SFX74594.1 ABC transporter [Marinospirillum alkaliphilum DSM 21637]
MNASQPSILRLQQLGSALLQPFSLNLRGGEICCLTGTSGSGKSRLLRALADLEPHQGEVWLDDQNQQQTPAHLWRLQVRLVPAESQWWSDEVADHFPADYDPEDLKALGLSSDAMEWQVSRLSSGEKQRLALLRALAFPLKVLLLDEPTANLDPATTLRVEHWLKQQIARHRWPVVWVAHDREQVQRVADLELVIQDGEVQEMLIGSD